MCMNKYSYSFLFLNIRNYKSNRILQIKLVNFLIITLRL